MVGGVGDLLHWVPGFVHDVRRWWRSPSTSHASPPCLTLFPNISFTPSSTFPPPLSMTPVSKSWAVVMRAHDVLEERPSWLFRVRSGRVVAPLLASTFGDREAHQGYASQTLGGEKKSRRSLSLVLFAWICPALVRWTRECWYCSGGSG